MKRLKDNISGATRHSLHEAPHLPRRHIAAIGAILLFLAVVAPFTPSGNVSANRTEELPLPIISQSTVNSEQPSAAQPTTAEVSPLPPATPEKPVEEITWAFYQVRPGDSLSKLMSRAGFTDRDAYIAGKTPGGSLTQLYPGQTLGFATQPNGELAEIRHKLSALESVVYRASDGKFEIERELKEPEVRVVGKSGEITSSLFLAGQHAGLSDNLIMELANLFGGVIDFVLDPREGDTLYVIYETLYLDDQYYSDGNIIAAAFTNKGETFTAYRYTDSEGRLGYYNERGESMRKAFLMAPLDFTRISSNFNPRRVHPVYKTTRPHRGTDYAAPKGTPVFAAGDGRVIEAGYSKANGNYVFIQHGEKYVTKYLHLDKRHVKANQRVSQSQIIGTVGSTGTATGNHLHYEFLVNGVHQNPRTIHKKLPKAKSLSANELPRFLAAVGSHQDGLAQLIAAQQAESLARLDATN
jgi:murein DD-endopeptidase MepM/ murein hydrolase activator NlpD